MDTRSSVGLRARRSRGRRRARGHQAGRHRDRAGDEAQPSANTLPGFVEALLFMGDRYEARVALGGEQRILLFLGRGREWREGQRVRLTLPPELVSVWPA
jgi:hypothetical protein